MHFRLSRYRIYRSETPGAGAHWEPVSGIVQGTGMYMCILDSIYDRPAGEDSLGTPIPAAFCASAGRSGSVRSLQG